MSRPDEVTTDTIAEYMFEVLAKPEFQRDLRHALSVLVTESGSNCGRAMRSVLARTSAVVEILDGEGHERGDVIERSDAQALARRSVELMLVTVAFAAINCVAWKMYRQAFAESEGEPEAN